MKIVEKILSWILVIVFFTAIGIIFIDFISAKINVSDKVYSKFVFTLLICSFLLWNIKLWFFDEFNTSKKKLKIGLDIHGICDANPEFFSELSRLFVDAGHDVHIITGRRVSDGALDEIKDLNLSYTHFFSISDYHVEKGTKVWEDDDGNPWLEGELWDRTKGDYCAEHQIDFHIDDTARYGDYFKTTFMLSKIFKRAE
jgi:hypothetical protein